MQVWQGIAFAVEMQHFEEQAVMYHLNAYSSVLKLH